MEQQHNETNIIVTFDGDNNNIIITVDNEDNQIIIPSNMYLPLISVLLDAGISMQKDNIVDLGLTESTNVKGDKK